MKNKFQEIVRGGDDGYYEISRRKKAVEQSKKDSRCFTTLFTFQRRRNVFPSGGATGGAKSE